MERNWDFPTTLWLIVPIWPHDPIKQSYLNQAKGFSPDSYMSHPADKPDLTSKIENSKKF